MPSCATRSPTASGRIAARPISPAPELRSRRLDDLHGVPRVPRRLGLLDLSAAARAGDPDKLQSATGMQRPETRPAARSGAGTQPVAPSPPPTPRQSPPTTPPHPN